MRSRISFIGLGQMGSPIVSRLVQKLPIHVWNRTHEKVRKQKLLNSANFKQMIPMALEDMTNMEYVFTCLPSTTESGWIIRKLARQAKECTTFVDLSSGCYQESVFIGQDIYPHRYIINHKLCYCIIGSKVMEM